jgi:hypothetical protein
MQFGLSELVGIGMIIGFMVLAIGLVVFIRDFWRMHTRLRMSSLNAPLGSTELEPHTLRVQAFLPEALLWHLTRLPGVQVVSTKTVSGNPGHFESCFLYKDRLFAMEQQTYFVTISLLGQPPSKALFAEVENHVQRYNWLTSLPGAIANTLRFLFLPRNPPRGLLDRYCPDYAKASVGSGKSIASIDPLAEAEVYLACGHKKLAIEILERASQANPTRDDIRERLSELKVGN